MKKFEVPESQIGEVFDDSFDRIDNIRQILENLGKKELSGEEALIVRNKIKSLEDELAMIEDKSLEKGESETVAA